MLEQRYNGNIFLLPMHEREAAVVTTNGVIRRDGTLVMGAGIAKYCRDHHRGIDMALANKVRSHGNHAYYAGEYRDDERIRIHPDHPTVKVLSMPTKHDWRDNSDLDLIRTSCYELTSLADNFNLTRIYLPMPGCTNGKLDYVSQVRPVLTQALDDRFVVCVPDNVADCLDLPLAPPAKM